MNDCPVPSVDFYRAFFDAASDAILVCDYDGTIVAANAACGPLFGFEPETLHGRHVETLVPERFRHHAQVREEYAKAPSPRAMGRGAELVARHADGHDIPVDIALTPLDVAGQRLVACAVRDMRTRPSRGETLRVQATALRSAANGIVITDRQGTITWVNPAACQITGYAAEELVGVHTRILKSGEHDQAFYATLWKTVLAGETWSGTIVNRRKDGALYYEEQTIAPVVDEEGTVSHFIAIKQDVTQARMSQRALERAHEELEERLRVIEALNSLLHDLAVRDPLTGLHNRRYLEETAAINVAAGAERDRTASAQRRAVASIDIDHFKQVNDAWGHAAGDVVLQRLADVLRANVRGSDTVCRLGGEEFLVLMPGATREIAEARAEQWRKSFAELPLRVGGVEPIFCTISVGVAVSSVPDEAFDAIFRRADAALYEAKRNGRNRVVNAAADLPAAR